MTLEWFERSIGGRSQIWTRMQSEWEMEVILEYIDNYLKKFEQGGKKRDRVVGCVKCREGFFFFFV